jgi:hypothetical protein
MVKWSCVPKPLLINTRAHTLPLTRTPFQGIPSYAFPLLLPP